MKRIATLAMILALVTLFTACSPSGYKLIEEGGTYYIKLRNITNSTGSSDLLSTDAAPRVHFDSVGEMKNDITTGNFTKEELAKIAAFDKNDSGQIQICNIDKLYEPKLSDLFNSYLVKWYGDSYRFKLTSSNSAAIGNFTFQTKENFDKNVAYYTNPNTDKLHSLTTNDDGSITYEYTSSFGIYVRLTYRTIELDSKQLFIVEEVVPEISEDIPDRYQIWGCEHGQYYYLTINKHEVKLTLEQLSQFGIREYVETVTE